MGKLVIDDAPIEREVLERALTGAGFRVVTAADGQSGLAAVASTADFPVLVQTIAELTGHT